MTLYNPTVRRVWTLANGGGALTLSAAGTQHFGPLDVQEACDLGLYVAVAGAVTGTTPTLDAQIDALDPAGNVYAQLAKITQITATGNGTAFCGLRIGTGIVLPERIQVTFTLGGTTPVFNGVSATLFAR